MARSGDNIYLRKDGRWEGRYIKGRKCDGKPQFGFVYGKSYSDVKDALASVKTSFQMLSYRVIVYGDGSFNDWVKYYLYVLTEPYVKKSTFALYKNMYLKHIEPVFGNEQISGIGQNDIQAFVDSLKKTLKTSTLNGVMRLLKAIFSSAIERNAIVMNPCIGIQTPKSD